MKFRIGLSYIYLLACGQQQRNKPTVHEEFSFTWQ